MKKNYITPKINLAKANIECAICKHSIQNGDEFTAGKDIEDKNSSWDIDSKNRFYNDSEDDGWD